MNQLSNTIIGFLNLFTLLTSIPIICVGLYMSKNNTTCDNFLQKPLIALGFLILIVSLVGFIGACCHVACALWVYLVIMLVVIVALMIVTVFGFVVTGQGGVGAPVPGRVYKEYHLLDYSSWLRARVKEAKNWDSIKGCVVGSKSCDKVVTWTPFDYMRNNLSPIQSGCCKPPTACTYGQQPIMMDQDPDCYKWNNDPSILCYDCDSCKAGVLDTIRKQCHKFSILNAVILILLIALYSVGCCAFQNTRRAEAFANSRISKMRPRWDSTWSRWWRGGRDDLW